MKDKITVKERIVEKHVRNLRKGFHYWSQVGPEEHTALGDYRWTAELILSTWVQAETGRPPENGLEYQVGNSDGGFDVLDFKFPPEEQCLLDDTEIDLSIPLNRRKFDREIEISLPIYGGGMSYGSISEQVMLARAFNGKKWNTFTSTGEGGYPESLVKFKDNIITQVATGMFGVREETIQYAPIVELKYAQGAKPGLGGHLLGDKATTSVAKMRESVPWVSLFSPFPFHSVYSVEDHRKQVDWIKTMNPEALVSVKVSTSTDVDMVAVGSYYAGAHIIHLDGAYGGTGAAPEIAKKNIAMPIEFAIPKVHNYLLSENIRDEITLIASGGLRTVYDIAKAIALGADGCVIVTAELVALGCTRCSNCERGRGCLRGLVELAYQRDKQARVIETLMWFMDQRYSTGSLRRSSLLTLYDECLSEVREVIRKTNFGAYAFQAAGDELLAPNSLEQTVVIDARGYETEGERSLGRELVRLHANGFYRFIVARSAGHRFIGCGFGPDSRGVRVDVFGSSGDYLASGMDRMEVYVHDNAQDQLAQIMRSGKLVVYGDVGQTLSGPGLSQGIKSEPQQIRLRNIMSPMRMIALYDLAKANRTSVCGMENKSKYHLSYFTRFGDEASDIEAIRHLYKSQVKQLAKHLEVPNGITKPPTAGLREEQTDEAELGFSYKEADLILYLRFEHHISPSQIANTLFTETQKDYQGTLKLLKKVLIGARPTTSNITSPIQSLRTSSLTA